MLEKEVDEQQVSEKELEKTNGEHDAVFDGVSIASSKSSESSTPQPPPPAPAPPPPPPPPPPPSLPAAANMSPPPGHWSACGSGGTADGKHVLTLAEYEGLGEQIEG